MPKWLMASVRCFFESRRGSRGMNACGSSIPFFHTSPPAFFALYSSPGALRFSFLRFEGASGRMGAGAGASSGSLFRSLLALTSTSSSRSFTTTLPSAVTITLYWSSSSRLSLHAL
eukprot:CAMPEP_0173276918 /NCGR_PEP_ID=MMETSP1143-20121109/3785_1 /TAXON_ID=483371 /ORGANISM="non described non described, Strain CCMP2298" /LENGTH=115 /DNA_ID=CAMNT_0014213939 /DNA_START=63 /DNA_END=407 /DNA_ORIENTATION=+